MPAKTGKPPANYYKSDVSVEQSTNVGFDSTPRKLISGDGASSSLSLSDDVLSVQPVNDDTVATLICKNSGGSNILAVDTTNSLVKVGVSQVNSTTLYQKFSVVNVNPSANYHYPMGIAATDFSSAGLAEDNELGNGTDPATILDISAATAESNAWVHYYWYLPDAITLDSAIVLSGGGSASDAAMNFHIMSYTLDTSSNYGDLSAGVVVADQGSATSAIDEDVIKSTSLTIQSADIAAGKVLIATYESDSTSITSSQMIVKYHIQ